MSNIVPRTYIKETLQLRSNIEGAFLELGERLYRIREERMYEGEYQDFDEFLLTAKLSKPTASKLITVYETFVLKYDFPVKTLAGVGYSSLYMVASRADTKTRALELVQKAALLTRDDLQESLRKEEGTHQNCRHTDTRLVRVCNDCGHRKQIFEKE